MWSLNKAAITAVNAGIAVHGSVRTPASRGEYPCTVCRKWKLKKTVPNMPKAITIPTELVSEAAVAEQSQLHRRVARSPR